nr:basic proline-rich protein-like isoform X2 [Desmodus rotundus]
MAYANYMLTTCKGTAGPGSDPGCWTARPLGGGDRAGGRGGGPGHATARPPTSRPGVPPLLPEAPRRSHPPAPCGPPPPGRGAWPVPAGGPGRTSGSRARRERSCRYAGAVRAGKRAPGPPTAPKASPAGVSVCAGQIRPALGLPGPFPPVEGGGGDSWFPVQRQDHLPAGAEAKPESPAPSHPYSARVFWNGPACQKARSPLVLDLPAIWGTQNKREGKGG